MKRSREQSPAPDTSERMAPSKQPDSVESSSLTQSTEGRTELSNEMAERKQRLAELDRELKTAAAPSLSSQTATREAKDAFHQKHGEWVNAKFGHVVRRELALRELGEHATSLQLGIFRARRALELLPRSQRERLTKEELVVLSNMATRWEKEHLPPTEVHAGDEKPLAMRLAAPDIRTALTRGEHDRENDNQTA